MQNLQEEREPGSMVGWIQVGRKAAGEQDQRPGGGSEKGAAGSSDAWLTGGRKRRGCWAFGPRQIFSHCLRQVTGIEGPPCPFPFVTIRARPQKADGGNLWA